MMEKANSHYSQGLLRLERHRETTFILAHGMQPQSFITGFFHRAASPLIKCQGVTIEGADVYQHCWVQRHMVHTNTRWCRSFLPAFDPHMLWNFTTHQATMDIMSPHHTLLPYIVILHFMLMKSFQESLPIVKPHLSIKNSVMNL